MIAEAPAQEQMSSLPTIQTGMPLDEFIRQSDEQRFELINGVRRLIMPTVFGHSSVMHMLFSLLYAFTQMRLRGDVLMETTFTIPDKQGKRWVEGSRVPDVMFYVDGRIAAYKQSNPDWRERPLELIPDFVAEVVSPTDKFTEIDEKMDAYLADGVRLIWLIDPQRKKAIVYAPDADPRHLTGDAVLDGGEIMSGFSVVLSSLFA